MTTTHLDKWKIENPIFKFEDEKVLVEKGIFYLNQHISQRDEEINKSMGKASDYSSKETRVIRRVEDFITVNPQNLQWLHDFLLEHGKKLHKDIFEIFFIIWSNYYNINNNKY